MLTRLIERLELVGTGAAIVAISLFLGLTLLVLGRIVSLDDVQVAYETVADLSRLQEDVQVLAIAAERSDRHEVLRTWQSVERRVSRVGDAVGAAYPASAYPAQLREWMRDVELPIRQLASASEADATVFEAVHIKAKQLRFALRGAMGEVISHSLDDVAARNATIGKTIWGVVACVAGSLLCGTWLVMRLLHEVRRARRAEADVKYHNDRLQELVAERTRALSHTEAQLRNAINTAPDGFAAFDADGLLFAANDIAREVLPAAATALTLEEVITASQGFEDPKVVASTPGTHTAEVEGPRGIWTMVSVRQQPDGTAVIRFADISAYKQATETLERAVLHEQNLRRLYREVVSVVSHQLRTPLAIIDSGAQKILRRGASASWSDIADRAHQIRTAAAGLVALVDGTLDSARLDLGEIAFSPQTVDLNGLLTNLTERLREVYPARRFKVEIGDLPAEVNCDPLLLEHVIGNLVSNSVKYSGPETPVSIIATANRDALSIVVCDEGVGIPHEELESVFELSYRGRNVGRQAGSGVGLHFVRQVVRLHGGDIRVVSAIGAGTTVTLDLPMSGPTPQLAA